MFMRISIFGGSLDAAVPITDGHRVPDPHGVSPFPTESGIIRRVLRDVTAQTDVRS